MLENLGLHEENIYKYRSWRAVCQDPRNTEKNPLGAHFKGCIHDMTRSVSLLPMTHPSHRPLLSSPSPSCTLSHFSTNRKIKAKIDPSEAVLTEACFQNEGSESYCLHFFLSQSIVLNSVPCDNLPLR